MPSGRHSLGATMLALDIRTHRGLDRRLDDSPDPERRCRRGTSGGVWFSPSASSHPLIIPSLLKNRGIHCRTHLGLAFFAAVSGLGYVVSLYFQLVLHLSPSHAALGLVPVMVGIIVASIACRPLLTVLGRRLVVIGLSATLFGTLGLWFTILRTGVSVTPWLTAPSLLIVGLGMGASFSTIFEVALGDVSHEEAGSASGSLSAVQQLATAIGAAIVTTVFFEILRQGAAPQP